MRMLILEDDSDQFEFVSEQLRNLVPKPEIRRISREAEFRSKFEEIASNSPDVAIIDVMLPWSDQDRLEIMPKEIKDDGGHFRAGFRCARALLQDHRTRNVKLFLYSVLDRGDVQNQLEAMEANCRFIRKEEDLSNLIRELKSYQAREGS